MKIAVVFYSYDGSTKAAAKVISERFSADTFELQEARKRGKSPFSFMAAGFSASIGKRSRLKNTFAQQMKEYGRIYIGTPIWAGKATPAVNSFIRSLDAEGKEVVLFTVQADPEPEKSQSKSLDFFRVSLEKRGAKVLNIIKLHGAPPGKTAEIAYIKKQLESKLN